jgi:endogenous inhibitor of DNA gyrase (YacG/DUF329 family)
VKEIKQVRVKCSECGRSFGSALWHQPSVEVFEHTSLSGSTEPCPYCKKVTKSDQSTLSYELA